MNDRDGDAEQKRAKLARLLTKLVAAASRATPGASVGAAAEQIFREDRDAYTRKALNLAEFKPLWWQTVCSPSHVWLFDRKRREVRSGSEVTRADWVSLSRLVSRIRYGYQLDEPVARHLDRLIRSGFITARDAWRLTHSLGCRVVRGRIAPTPVSQAVALMGVAAAIAMAGICALFAYTAIAALFAPCVNVCAFTGNVIFAYGTAHLAPLLLCATWGRRDASGVIQELMDMEPGGSSRYAHRALVVRLTW